VQLGLQRIEGVVDGGIVGGIAQRRFEGGCAA